MKKCLVIEDVEVSRYTYRMFMEDLGFHITEAADGESAINELRRDVFDVILLDWHLKQMDGLGYIPKIKDLPGKSQVPIIVISGVENQEQAQKVYDAGANDFIIKPTSEDKIKASLKKVGVL